MTTLAELAEAIDEQVPFAEASEWDRVGIQFGELTAKTGLVGVCHEVTESVIVAVRQDGIRTLVTYHPLLFDPATSLVAGTSAHGRTYRLIRDGVALISVHTAFDVAIGGTADSLAAVLDLTEVEPFAAETEGQLIGRIGSIASTSLGKFALKVSEQLKVPAIRISGDATSTVARVAVLPGSGGRAVAAAQAAGADVYVTGDVSHHAAAEAETLGMCVVDAGHMPTERPGMAQLVALVSDVVPSAIDLTMINTDPWES